MCVWGEAVSRHHTSLALSCGPTSTGGEGGGREWRGGEGEGGKGGGVDG